MTIQKDDVGVVITATVKDETGTVVNVSSATATKLIRIKKPYTTTVMDKAASFVTDGSDGKLRYTTIAGDLDEPGVYKWQVKVIITAGTYYGDWKLFTVYPNL